MSAARFKKDNSLQCSVHTVQRVLQQTDWLTYYKLMTRLLFTTRHKAERVAWCEAPLAEWRCSPYWDAVVFSDEKR